MKASNGIIKLVSTLDRVQKRRESGLFMAEGKKCVFDLMDGFNLRHLLVTDGWVLQNSGCIDEVDRDKILTVSPKEMERMSNLSTPSGVLGVFEMPEEKSVGYDLADRELVLMLDDVRDPGNLGTIIRAADWFGVKHIICSLESVDVYNPKVVMSTMGALARVSVSYVNLEAWLEMYNGPVYGTFLDGEVIYDTHLERHGVIVMGNEGRGVGPSISSLCTHRLFIPPYPPNAATSESLNVGMATSIVLNEFRRRNG